MTAHPPSLQQLIQRLSRLPGIGEKTAERLAMHLVDVPFKEAEALSRAILHLKESIRLCRRCFGLSDTEVCHICRQPARNTGSICVVETIAEMVAIEKSGAFNGTYHVLQGSLSPMDGIGPEDLRIRELLARIAAEPVEEVLLATGTQLEGESTAIYLAQQLKNLPVRISRIASGVPMGGDLKYVDPFTIKRAIDNRRGMN